MKKIYLSAKANPLLLQYLSRPDIQLCCIGENQITYPAVATHADIFCCRLGADENASVFVGDKSELGFRYPHNIKFNAVCLERYFIHNIKYTSSALLQKAQSLQLTLINVRQGYTKCNTVVVDGHSIITADQGIINTTKKYPDIDVLPISQGFVRLEGFEYGFLGGASGRVGNEMIFNGDLSSHPDFSKINRFIESRGLSVKYFPEYPLEDIGSIIAE